MPHRLLVGASQGDVSLDVLPELRDVFLNLTSYRLTTSDEAKDTASG
jgi:hypothetical protein